MLIAPKLAALAAAQGGPFTTAQARAVGYDPREIHRLLRSRQWTALRRGVYAETTLIPSDAAARHVLQLRGVLLCLTNHAAASHVTSAALHQINLLTPDFSLVNITREGAGSSRTEAGVRHHDASLPAGHLTKIDDILTTSAARTIVDFARVAGFESALVATESALNLGLVTLAELREVLEYCVDWPGARNAGRVVSFASPYSETPGETLGRIAFDVLGLPQPSQQTWIYDARGLIARVDYWWEQYRTVGEFDGRVKYVGAGVADDTLLKEKKREDRLRDAGAEVFRFDWAEAWAKSPSIRWKAEAAFDRAVHSTVRPALRFVLQPPPV